MLCPRPHNLWIKFQSRPGQRPSIVGWLDVTGRAELKRWDGELEESGIVGGLWIWAIFTGVNDVKEYNRSIQQVRLRVAPQMVAFRSRSGPVVGVELLRFGL